MEGMVMFGSIYEKKRVLVTGHTGFKGAWISLWLHLLGARVSGYALAPRTAMDLRHLLPSDIFEHEWIADIRDIDKLRHAIETVQPDLIFHMAAQPLVRLSYAEPLETFSVNAWGTALLLETIRSLSCPASVIIVTSDKCYRNDGHGQPFSEDDPLGGGHDVYSMSKAATELVVAAWHASFFSREAGLGRLATVRAGNVIGGGDYALDRILPDCVRAQISGDTVVLRNPSATRPWQHVLECLSGYLCLGQRLLTSPEDKKLLNLNFGPDPESERTVEELVECFFTLWPGHWEICQQANALPEASRLTLSNRLARETLAWQPTWDFRTAVRMTAEWYRFRHESGSAGMLDLTYNQIKSYAAEAAHCAQPWTQA